MTGSELSPNKLIFSYFVFVYSYLQQTDPDFQLDQNLAQILAKIHNHINIHLEWTYNIYKSILYSQNVLESFLM